MKPVEALALVAGHIDEELLKRNEYLAAENEILRSKIKGRVRLNDAERIKLATLGSELGRKALENVAAIVKPETIMSWFRDLVAKRFDGSSSNKRRSAGRPRTPEVVEKLIVKIARENRSWGCHRIVGALKNLGIKRCPETVAEILRRHGLTPTPNGTWSLSWSEFIRSHQHVLSAADFFTAEVVTSFGIVTYYVLFFMHLDTRRVHIAGITTSPDERWTKQVARNVTMADWGFLQGRRYLIIDRDKKYAPSVQRIIRETEIEVILLPPKSPNMNAYCERWVRSVKSELLSRMIFFNESSLREALREYVEHYHSERNHQVIGNVLLFPEREHAEDTGEIKCKERLGGALKFYYREAA